jgi:hypothetical protein
MKKLQGIHLLVLIKLRSKLSTKAISVAILKTPQTALRGERRSDASPTLSSTSNSLLAFWIASIFVKLSLVGSVVVADVEAATTEAAVGCWVSVRFFFLGHLIDIMVRAVEYYNPRMASREIGEALNDEVGGEVSKTASSGHEIAKEQSQ